MSAHFAPGATQAKTLEIRLREELTEMKQAAKSLQASHPGLTRCLNQEANNPDVERLIEATAYLCASVRARIDAQAPQYAREMAEMVAPWAQRELPAACIVAIDVPVHGNASIAHLPAGTELVGMGANKQISFRTVQGMTLLPLAITEVRLDDDLAEGVALVVTLNTSAKLAAQALVEHGLTFFVDGPQKQAQALALALWHGTRRAQLHNGHSFSALPMRVDEPALSAAPPLTPCFADDAPAHMGALRMRDLFCLPQKHLYVNVRLTEAPEHASLGQDICITLMLDRAFGGAQTYAGATLKLHTVPSINLVQADAIPTRLKLGQSRYVLRPQQDHTAPPLQVLAIKDAHLLHQANQQSQKLFARHSYLMADSDVAEATPMVALEQARTEGIARAPAHLHIIYPQGKPQPLQPGTLSAQLWCHNAEAAAHCPKESLKLQVSHPRAFAATNLTATTQVVPPTPAGPGLMALVALLGQRCRTNLTRQDVQRVLHVLKAAHPEDSAARRAQQTLIDSIVDVRTSQSTRLWRGSYVLCLDVTLSLDTARICNLGQAYLFADSLSELWADALPAHGVMRMRLILSKWGRTITWPLRSGMLWSGKTSCTLDDEHR